MELLETKVLDFWKDGHSFRSPDLNPWILLSPRSWIKMPALLKISQWICLKESNPSERGNSRTHPQEFTEDVTATIQAKGGHSESNLWDLK